MNLLAWIGVYVLAFAVTARIAYIRYDRKRGPDAIPGELKDDQGTAIVIGLAWPTVWAFLIVRQLLRWTVLRPTRRQTRRQRAADERTVRATFDAAVHECPQCHAPHLRQDMPGPPPWPVVPIKADPLLSQRIETP